MRYIHLFAFLLPLVFCENVAFCSMGSLPTPARKFDRATVVFAGVVDSIIVNPNIPGFGTTSVLNENVLRVGQVWKGPLNKEFRVFTFGSHGPRFTIGRHYFVYATLMTIPTSRTQVLVILGPMDLQRVERALWDRFTLREPFVVDPYLAVPRPSEAELASKRANAGARRALEELHKESMAPVEQGKQ